MEVEVALQAVEADVGHLVELASVYASAASLREQSNDSAKEAPQLDRLSPVLHQHSLSSECSIVHHVAESAHEPAAQLVVHRGGVVGHCRTRDEQVDSVRGTGTGGTT